MPDSGGSNNDSAIDLLLLDSAISGIDEEAPPSQIEAVLRSVAQAIAGADPLRRAIVRDAVVRRLRRAGVSCAVTLANVAFGSEKNHGQNLSPNLAPFADVAPWPDPVDGATLLSEMAAILRRYLVLSPEAAHAEALWCLHTYVHDIAAVSPNLCLSSPEKRCGKTRNLQVLSCLVRRPLHTSNLTVGALTRVLDQYAPTLLIDEADTIFVNGGRSELRGILNAGLYRSTAFVLRCTGERRQPKSCAVWCPKAIALIGRLPSTLEDRSIVVPLRRRYADESVDLLEYPKLFVELEPLRRRATRWAAEHQNHLANAAVHVPDILHDRGRDLWRPLLAIAHRAGQDWTHLGQDAAIALSTTATDPNAPVQLLARIRALFHQTAADRLSSESIVQALMRDENSPLKAVSLTKAHLARLLAPFGIRPTIVSRTRTQVSRGYLLRDFQSAFSQYRLQ
jgi:hypothetical protein